MKVAIIGAGASGLICAASLKEKCSFCDVTVFESKDRVGKKILATGNGRCNLMNINENFNAFSSADFVKHALTKFSVESNLNYFSDLGLYTRTDEEGRIYPLSNQATSVLDALRYECERLGVKFVCETEITSIKKQGKLFCLNDKLNFDKVVVAFGSKAGVKNYKSHIVLQQLGVNLTAFIPSLTKICVKEKELTKRIKGVRSKASLKLYKNNSFLCSENGELLFTEYGLSGIAIMQLSFYISKDVKADYKIKCDFVPEFDYSFLENAVLKIISRNKKAKCENLLSGFIPKKLFEMILKSLDIYSQKEVGELSKSEIKAIVSKVKGFNFTFSELRGFEDAQTVSGGVALFEVDRKTLESKKIKGLYFSGEVIDIDALCGGYNLWWAWSSGRLCAESVAKTINKGERK